MGSGSASNPPQAAHHAPPDYANMYPHAPAVPAPMPAHLGRLPPGGLANPHSYIQNPGTVFFFFCNFVPFCLLLPFGPFGPFGPFDHVVPFFHVGHLCHFDHMGSAPSDYDNVYQLIVG